MTTAKSTQARIEIDGIESVSEFGELAKLAMQIRMEAVIEWIEGVKPDEPDHYRIALERLDDRPEELGQEVANLFILWCLAMGYSGQTGIDKLTHQLNRREMPMHRPIQDVMSIGGGPDHEGHGH